MDNMADTYRFLKHNNISNFSRSDSFYISNFLPARNNFLLMKAFTHGKGIEKYKLQKQKSFIALQVSLLI